MEINKYGPENKIENWFLRKTSPEQFTLVHNLKIPTLDT